MAHAAVLALELGLLLLALAHLIDSPSIFLRSAVSVVSGLLGQVGGYVHAPPLRIQPSSLGHDEVSGAPGWL